MRLFTSPRITSFLQRFRPPEGEAITAKVLNKSIETAQKRVEQRNYQIRKHTLEYDDVMNKQRAEIYSFRNDVLHSDNPLHMAKQVVEGLVVQMAEKFFMSKGKDWNPEGFRAFLMTHFPVTFEAGEFDGDYLSTVDIEDKAIEKVITALEHKLNFEKSAIEKAYAGQEGNLPNADKILSEVIRNILIRHVDKLWQEHLLRIDHLRSEVNLRTVGQKDPLQEFKHEAFTLFDNLTVRIKTDIAHALFKFQMVVPNDNEPPSPEKRRPQPRPFRMNLSLLPEIGG
jgi:preprotein translocase subunit SecA